MASSISEMDLDAITRDLKFSGNSLRGGDMSADDGNVGFILVAVAMGCIAALVFLYMIKQYTTIPETICKLFSSPKEKSPTSLKAAPGKPENNDKAAPVKLNNETKEPVPAAPSEARTTQVSNNMPKGNALKADKSGVKLSMISNEATMSQKLTKQTEDPKMPGVPKANGVTGHEKVYESNKQLIDAANGGSLRQKLSRASWGVTPVQDKPDELPFYTSELYPMNSPLSRNSQEFYKNMVKKNTEKILNAGAAPVLFELPQNFNSKPTETPKIGLNLSVEKKK